MEAQLDLDALSGLTEIDLETEELFGSKNIMRLAVSLRPSLTKDSQMVSLSSRYVVCNESEDAIAIRQCYMEVCSKWHKLSHNDGVIFKFDLCSDIFLCLLKRTWKSRLPSTAKR